MGDFRQGLVCWLMAGTQFLDFTSGASAADPNCRARTCQIGSDPFQHGERSATRQMAKIT